MPEYLYDVIKNLIYIFGVVLFPHFVLAQSPHLDQIIDKKIDSMTLEEKIGQLFIIGFPQTTLTNEVETFIKVYKPGSYLLFKRNITSVPQIKKLTTDLYRASYAFTKLPPLIATDQEGGNVSRLPIEPPPPNALALGKTESSDLSHSLGYEMALFLRSLGFNLNLAPVLDIADPDLKTFINLRSFGKDPNVVADMGYQFSKGTLKGGIVPTAKHFPGTGVQFSDPHNKITVNKSSLEQLMQNDLIPFKKYFSLGPVSAVMLSHSTYPKIGTSNEPASFSKEIIQRLLRTELKYNGIVITDDLQMSGSRLLLRPEHASLKSLKAGADIVMLTYSFKDQGRAIDLVRKAVDSGELPIAEVNEKLRRILRIKAFANLERKKDLNPDPEGIDALTSKNYIKIDQEILEQNLRLSMIPKSLPLKKKLSRAPSALEQVCLFSPSKKFIDSFMTTASGHVKGILLQGKNLLSLYRKEVKNQACNKTIIVINGARSGSLLPHLKSSSQNEIVIINLQSPALTKKYRQKMTIIDLYFNHENSGELIAKNLLSLFNSSSPLAIQ